MIISPKNYNKFKFFNAVITFILISLSVTGTECEKLLTGEGIPQEMIGNWKLMEQTGSLQDICIDETVDFQANGVAILICPNSNSISRNFIISNNVLTYTQTSVSYGIETLNNNELFLIGQNVSRNLRYEKIITDKSTFSSGKEAQFIETDLDNSSEIAK